MASRFQDTRSVLAALALGSLATAQEGHAQKLTGALPNGRSEHSVSKGDGREFTRRDVGDLSVRRQELEVLGNAGGNGPVLARCNRAQEILTSVIKDLSSKSSVKISGEDAQLLHSVLAELPTLTHEWRSLRRAEQEQVNLLGVAESSSAPSWLVHSCKSGLWDVQNVSARWRAGAEWKNSLSNLVNEYQPRKRLVEMWGSGRSALAAHSEFEFEEGERFSSSFERSLRSLRSDSEQLISRLRAGPLGEPLLAFSGALSPLYRSAESLNLTYARLASDTTYRAQCFQEARLETMMSTVKKGLYIFAAGCTLAFVGMFLDGIRRGRDHARGFFSSRNRPGRELTVKEQERIHRGW